MEGACTWIDLHNVYNERVQIGLLFSFAQKLFDLVDCWKKNLVKWSSDDLRVNFTYEASHCFQIHFWGRLRCNLLRGFVPHDALERQVQRPREGATLLQRPRARANRLRTAIYLRTHSRWRPRMLDDQPTSESAKMLAKNFNHKIALLLDRGK